MALETPIRVTVAYAAASRDVREVILECPSSCTVLQALQRSGLLQLFPTIDLPTTVVGVWGSKAKMDQVLHANDRIEIYRSLKVDPKVARRERFVRQGAKRAGLFVKKRVGAKAGY